MTASPAPSIGAGLGAEAGAGSGAPPAAASFSFAGGPTSSSAALTVTLALACVVPGEEQAILVQTHGPASVAFDTHYADGRLGADYGGEAIGQTDSSGTYRSAWFVSHRAPIGAASVNAGITAGGVTSTASAVAFNVADQC